MNRFRSSIATFFVFLLSAGLLISTLHIHELLSEGFVAHNISTSHELSQDHNKCPICAVVFEADFDENTVITNRPDLGETVTGLSDQIVSTPIFSSKDGRSPPITA